MPPVTDEEITEVRAIAVEMLCDHGWNQGEPDGSKDERCMVTAIRDAAFEVRGQRGHASTLELSLAVEAVIEFIRRGSNVSRSARPRSRRRW